MTWFKVDDGFYDHPKAQALEDGPCPFEALTLWLKAGSWSARYLTDGVVPKGQVKRFGVKPKAADELVRVGLWVRNGDDFAFHQWAEHQPTRADVEGRRRATADRVKKHRNALHDDTSNGACNALHDAVETRIPGIRARSPVPSRPKDPPNPLAGEREQVFGAQRMSLIFRKRYLETRSTEPSMGGRNLGDFAQRVTSTAAAQCMDPEALFAGALEAWLRKPHGEIEQRAPYAAFAQAWGELTGSSRPRTAVRGLNAPEDV